MNCQPDQLPGPMAQAYRQALLNVRGRFGDPVRIDRHCFTTTLFFLGPDGREDTAVEIEADWDESLIRMSIVRLGEPRGGETVCLRHEETIYF